ncbi:MAG: BolA family protein [Amaricoccus sp.]
MDEAERRPTAASVRARLEAAFRPERLEVVDESDEHRGHAGWHEGGGSHFRVLMRAASLDGLSRVERSRAVHRALDPEFRAGLHALALDVAGSGA